MAAYTLADGEFAAHNKTLVASTVDTVTLGDDHGQVEVHAISGSAAIYFTVDGSTPTVDGARTYRLPATANYVGRVRVPTPGDTVVKLISSGTPSYSVVGVS